LAAELEGRFPEATVELKPGSGGRFEVAKDGVPVFEKSKLGRHAKPGEIVQLLEMSA
jgi:selT/selW/selH-like putative selenoprotein